MKSKKNIHLPDMTKLSREIERWAADNGNGSERIKHYKSEIRRLGGAFKKSFTPFKHRLLLEKHKNKKKEDVRQINANMGIFKRHLKKKKNV